MLNSLRFLWSGMVAAHLLVAILCCTVAGLLITRWLERRRSYQKIGNAGIQREHSLRLMEKAVLQYLEQHGDVDAGGILSLSLEELVSQLKSGSLSPEAVLHVYIEKVTPSGGTFTTKELVCLASLCSCWERDWGHVWMGGHNKHCGLVHFLGTPDAEDSAIVHVLKKQGAVPFVKTNVPQSLINFDCSNSIYGQTLNPHNHRKTCGGSSGGEGALVAGGGAILGVGTDVLGSIRVPCSFCGICGLKPSGDRLSEDGLLSPVSGMRSAVNMPGPMARDVDSLALFMKAVLCDDLFQLDPTIPPLPFRDEVYRSSERLVIGFYDTDGYFLPHPSERRAIQETKTLLEEAGHKLVPFAPPRIEYALNELCIRGFFADGGKTLLDKFKPDVVDPNLKQQLLLWRTPAIVKKIVAFFMRPVFPRIANHLEAHSGVSSVSALWRHYTAIKEYRREFIGEWRKLGLDALLCPALSPAFNIGHPGKLFGNSQTPPFIKTWRLLVYVSAIFYVGMSDDGGVSGSRPIWSSVYEDRDAARLCSILSGGCARCRLCPVCIGSALLWVCGASSLLSSPSSVSALWRHYTAIKEYRREFIGEWRKLGLDALLCPALSPAFNIGHPGKLFAGFSFTMLFNILNFPAGVLPVTAVSAEDEEELKHYKGYHNDLWDKELIQ
ncbi:PREDICTED: vitamin D3 hydroxylase-associated protein-like, partial [Nanorana parkeri]|uniref:vitamin D3 hydroxylase-associated protein-like n=1 Tax=Nanorana parkeri TaxID=125878 RepID=UPI00085405C5